MAFSGHKILVTGPTGQVGFVVAQALAKQGNEVWGVARFSDEAKKKVLEDAGVKCVSADLGDGDFSSIPKDFDYVVHLGVFRAAGDDFDLDFRSNAEGTGLLMSHCRAAKGFLACSTTGVYESVGRNLLKETSELGDNHRSMMTTYSITKIATEAVVRFAAREFNLPTIITRLCVPYGNNGGWPYYHLLMMKHGTPIQLQPDKPSLYSLIHEDDIVASIPSLLQAASVPANIVNWGGPEAVSIEDWSAYLGELTGAKPVLEYTEKGPLESVVVDTTKLFSIAPQFKTSWKDGFRRMVAAKHPDWLV
ncbi:MAG TPA: NAD(P)-dependent oxidoreductase [Alphaproteobacteria bacterium]|nr:NAD(P)-dependent oxidoreductase [Alphaproteobacteria bacterium]